LREEKQRRLSCSSTDRGDITKEALTPNCDIAKQTTGPWRAWENNIIAWEQIDKEKKEQFEPCFAHSICTELTTFYHVYQLSQAGLGT